MADAPLVVVQHLHDWRRHDIERATDMARKMICEWGMSDVMGPVSFGKKEDQIFLGREMSSHEGYSEKTAIEIDTEIRRIVQTQYDMAKKLLSDNRASLEKIAGALLEYETLDATDLDTLLKGGEITRPKPETRLKSPDEALKGGQKKPDDRPSRGSFLDPTPEPGSA
jgi:cell division protease FtsH